MAGMQNQVLQARGKPGICYRMVAKYEILSWHNFNITNLAL
jgi:hypothetical protein